MIEVNVMDRGEIHEILSNVQSFIGNSNDGIWAIDKNHKLIFFNSVMEKLYATAWNISLKDGINMLDHELQAEVPVFPRFYIRALKGEHFTEEVELAGNFYEVSFSPMYCHGEVDGAGIYARDITERKRVEEKLLLSEYNLRALIENTEDNIWSVDTNYCVIKINDRCAESTKSRFGVKIREGMRIIDHIPDHMRGFWKDFYDSVFENGKTRKEFSFVNQGEKFVLDVLGSPIISGGKVIGASMSARNITDIKKYESRLQSVIESKENILYMLAHDLKSPIHNIKGLLNLIGSETLPEKSQIDFLNKSCDRALTIIQELLYLSEIEREDFKVDMENINLADFISNMVSLYKPLADKRGVHIDFTSGSKNMMVSVNREMFSHVIENLISNAMKFTDKLGNIHLHVEGSEDGALVYVRDSGIGIPAYLQPFIFDKFSKARRMGLTGEFSSGLGMSIVKNIIDLHGGKIWFESEDRKGTCFFIKLRK